MAGGSHRSRVNFKNGNGPGYVGTSMKGIAVSSKVKLQDTCEDVKGTHLNSTVDVNPLPHRL